ncbi:MAG: sialidase family protein [Candidatus Margulisiibacteriota bacterium]
MQRMIFITALISLLACSIISCTQTQSTSTTTTSTTTTSLCIIKGPDRGTSPNDNDNPFRSLIVSAISPEVIYIGSEGNGIFKSIDGGTNWSWLRRGLRCSVNSYPEIYELAIHPTDNDLVYAATLVGYGPTDVGGPYKTTDGENWERKTSGISTNFYASAIDLDPADPGTLYLAIGAGESTGGADLGTFYDGGIYKSTNSGETWSQLSVPSPAEKNRVTHLIAWDSNNIYFCGTNFDNTAEAVGLMKSSDAGANWSSVNTPDIHVVSFDIAPLDKNIIIISERDSMQTYITTNEGSRWSQILFYSADVIRISPHNSDRVLFAHTENLYKSSDGMQTWHQVLTAEANLKDIEFSASDQNIVYASSEHLLVYKSTDGGETFTQAADLRNYIDTH